MQSKASCFFLSREVYETFVSAVDAALSAAMISSDGRAYDQNPNAIEAVKLAKRYCTNLFE